MAYKDDFATGDTIDASTFNELVKSSVYSFADLSTIQSSVSSPIDGQLAFAQDSETYYRYDLDSTTWVALFSGVGDITAVTITTASESGLGGGTSASSGDFVATLVIDANNLATATAESSDYLVIEDVTDNTTKKALISDIVSLGDITGVTVTTSSTSGLSGGSTASSGDFSASLTVDPSQLTDGSGITVDTASDLMILEDASDGTVYKVTPSQFASSGTDIGLTIALGGN